MPWLMSLINARPDDAIQQARDDTVSRAKDVWGLDYADSSNGLYPAGNQIGRAQLRPDIAYQGTIVFPRLAGGQWRTVWAAGGVPTGAITAVVPNALNGWGTWLDFIVDEDAFIIIEGFFSTATTPTIREVKFTLSGVETPVMQIEQIYNNGDDLVCGHLEVPAVVSPKSQVVINIRQGPIAAGIDEGFGIIGEVLGKRSFLIRQVL